MNTAHAFTALLALPTVLFLVNAIGIILCAGVLVSCICRVNAAKVTRGRVTFTQLMYLAFAFWAFGTALDLARGIVLEWHAASVGLGIVFHLLLTYKQWKGEDVVGDLLYWEDGHAGASNG
jgi:hypothetical protein